MATSAPLKLIALDVAGTVADIDGPSHVDRVISASPLPERDVREVLRDALTLKTLPSPDALTPELAEDVCRRLGIAREELPFGRVPCAPYRLRPGVVTAVREAAELAPVVLLANVSVFADSALGLVRETLAPYLSGEFLSWKAGAAKPDPAMFEQALRQCGVHADEFAHVGDVWREDIAPVLKLGGRAVWINPAGKAAPSLTPIPLDRVLTASSLDHAVAQLKAQWKPLIPR